MGGKSLRKCEVCGVRRVSKLKSDIFLARFPLNPNRCRLWVKATGYEDLAYLPIQRLNENKFICGNHFSKKMYNKKGNRLKRNAVPNLGLKTPLSDEILADFPICASGLETGIPDTGYHWNSEHSYSMQKAYPEARPDSLHMEQTNIVTTEAKLGSELVVEGEVDESLDNCIDFSMYSDDEDNIECFEDANDNGNKESTEDSNNALLHEGFLCNFCNSTISGYRYTCVQCPDYDLCASCEARGAHCLHYVLRIPRPKLYGEIKSLLDSVRTSLMLLNCAPEQVNILDMNDIKSETKDEEVDPFLDDGDIIENNAPETVESEHIPGDPLMEEIYTIEFEDAITNRENISIRDATIRPLRLRLRLRY